MPGTFNLLDEPWIPVLRNDGTVCSVGILQALEQAEHIRQIAASNPMDRVAVLRFLIALAHWCSDGFSDSGRFSGLIADSGLAKIKRNNDCFNLLGDGKRFYQDPAAERTRPVTDLLQEIPVGNNFWHFRHTTDNEDGLCPACCALGLLRLPLFSVSGLPDLKSGVNGSPPVYAIPLGKTLSETLALNFISHDYLGVPAWLDPLTRPIDGEKPPLLCGLTALSRRVWLHESADTPGVCACCGATDCAPILNCEFQSAGSLENAHWEDPHVVYLDAETRKSIKAPDPTISGRFSTDRFWANVFMRMLEGHPSLLSNNPAEVMIVGFPTKKALNNIDVWEHIVELPQSDLDSIRAAVALWQSQSRKMESSPLISRAKALSKAAALSINPHAESRIIDNMKTLIGGTGGLQEYQPLMSALAHSLAPGATTHAVERRRQIMKAAPRMAGDNADAVDSMRNKPTKGDAR